MTSRILNNQPLMTVDVPAILEEQDLSFRHQRPMPTECRSLVHLSCSHVLMRVFFFSTRAFGSVSKEFAGFMMMS